jgi:hypothetical protein
VKNSRINGTKNAFSKDKTLQNRSNFALPAASEDVRP